MNNIKLAAARDHCRQGGVTRLLLALAVLGLLLVAGCSAGTTSSTDNGSQAQNQATAPAKWVKVITLRGSADKQSAPFTLKGGEQKLIYSFHGSMAMLSVYLEKAGTDIQEQGGIPVVMADKPGKDSTRLSKAAGRYQITVTSANCDWTVTLFEKR
jgi:hypothetical protein